MQVQKFKGIIKDVTLKRILNDKDTFLTEYLPCKNSILFSKGTSTFLVVRKNAKYHNVFIIQGSV